jgi:sigma-B regulation protein RsbU (phosphoserine phosphatase)
MARVSTEETLRRLQAVTDAALSSLDVEDLLQALLERTRELLAADTAAIFLVDSTGTDLVGTAGTGPDALVHSRMRIPIGVGFAGRIAARATAATTDDADAPTIASTLPVDKGLAAMAGVPIMRDGRVAGVLQIGSKTPRTFGGEDIELLDLVADRASLALRSRLSRLDRATTLALQRSLLPDRPSKVDGFQVSARYIPGADVGVGGDWYDMFTLPTQHIGVVIGDVVGHGLKAAVVMGRIRSALRAYALETTDPADVLSRLDRKIQLFEPDAMATALYAVIDPSHDFAAISVAGHPPPLLIDGSGSVNVLPVQPDLPLGAHPNAKRRSTMVKLAPGTGLFCYTDGLVEQHHVPIRDRIRELVESLVKSPAEDPCSRAIATLLHDQIVADDVAMIAIRRVVDPQPGAGQL